jgi:hypothetical protein
MSTLERREWTLVTTLGEAAALVDEAGADVGLWKLPAEEPARRARARFTQLQLSSSTEGRAA